MSSPEHDGVYQDHTSTTNKIDVFIIKFGQSSSLELAFRIKLGLTQILSVFLQKSYDMKCFIMNNYFLPPKDNEV